MNGTVFHTPGGVHRNLLATMISASSRTSLRLEDQLTEALAWILDRDQRLAVRVMGLFVAGDAEATALVEQAERVGVSTQVRLPPLPDRPGSHLRPDLSLTLDDRELQLLVEVKAGADFNLYEVAGGTTIDQVTAYIAAWQSLGGETEARVRKVGSLTPEGIGPRTTEVSSLRANDVGWLDLVDLLRNESVESEVRAVAGDVADTIDFRFGSPDVSSAFLDGASRLALSIADSLVAVMSDSSRSNDSVFRPSHEHGHAGGYVNFTTRSGVAEKIWLLVTAPGASYAPVGSTTAFWLCFSNDHPPAAETLAGLASPDWARTTRDKAGYAMNRMCLEFDPVRVEADFPTLLEECREWALATVRESGLTGRDAKH